MKIVLTGATGFVGAEVMAQLLADDRIERVTCLTRRPLEREHPKLAVVVLADFASYDDALLAHLADHAAGIWALGGKASDISPGDYERVTHGFTLAFARAVAAQDRPFAFAYLSGMGADPTESSRFGWERATRHLKGRVERDLATVAVDHPLFVPYCFRPGGILPRRGAAVLAWLLRPLVVRVDVVAKAMIRAVVEGAPRQTIGNAAIMELASP